MSAKVRLSKYHVLVAHTTLQISMLKKKRSIKMNPSFLPLLAL